VYAGNQGEALEFRFGSVQAGGYEPETGAYCLVMQDDGNLCVYKGEHPGSEGLVFKFGTVQAGGYDALE
jgi:hypothetical protein